MLLQGLCQQGDGFTGVSVTHQLPGQPDIFGRRYAIAAGAGDGEGKPAEENGEHGAASNMYHVDTITQLDASLGCL
jgi:hypothetical protein